MKVILINPSSELMLIAPKMRREFLTPIIPAGIAYIAAVLEKNGIEVSVIDQVAKNIKNEEIMQKIRAENPDMVGFSCLTASMGNVKRISYEIKKYDKDIKIALGNLHASVFADELLKERVADIVVHGEGEFTMLETAKCIEDRGNLSNVKGISFVDNGSVYHNLSREPIYDLDDLPYPAIHLFDLDDYRNVPLAAIYNKRTTSIVGSRGCPYTCIFCSQDKIHKKPRYRKNNRIIEEMEFMNKRHKVRYFGFNDASFPYSKETGVEFCDEFTGRQLHKNINWVSEMRVDLADFELLKKMKDAGAHLVMYGFEVGNQGILDTVKQGVTLKQAKIAMEYTKKAGLMSLGLFMLGLPGETKETCEETINFAKELDCDFVKFNICVPYPGSGLFDMYKDKIKNADEFDKFNSWYDWFSGTGDLIYTPEGMTSKDLKNLQRKAMLSFYVRPRIVFKNIIKKRISLKFLFYGIYILTNSVIRIILDTIKKGGRK